MQLLWEHLKGRFAADTRVVTGVLLALIVLGTHVAVWLVPAVFEPLQDQTIDRLFRLRARIAPLVPTYDGTVFIVPIDDKSVAMRESFYLGRQDYGRLVENLHRAGTAVQFLDVIFAAPESVEGDKALAEALGEANNAYIGMAVGASNRKVTTAPSAATPELQRIIDNQRWDVEVRGDAETMLRTDRYFMTFSQVASQAKGIGYIDIIPDRDGVFRRVPLLVRDGDSFLPSLFFLVICDYLGIGPEDIVIEPGKQLTLRGARRPGSDQATDITIPIDKVGRMTVNFIGEWGSFQTYPFSSIYVASDDRFEMDDLRAELEGRIPVVSWFSTGHGDIGPVPTDPAYPRVGIWANAMNTILNGEFIRELSGWQMLFLVELPLLILLFIAATRMSTIPYVGAAVGLLGIYLLIVMLSFLLMNTILNVLAPILVLITSTPVVAAYQYHIEAEKRAKMHRELAVAREIQMDTLPKKMPTVEGYEVAGRSIPADETGGDCFDVIPLQKHRLMLLLGDATGHGIGPALSVTQVRAMLRLAARLNADLDSAVTHINDQLAEDLAANRFVTAFLGILDTRSHQVTHHSAGQGPLLHYHAASGEFEWMGASRMALGILGGLPGKPARTLAMEPGDILGLMTDGVFEQENSIHEQFDTRRVEDLIRSHENDSMSDLVRAIYAAIRVHRKQTPQSDDVTVLLVRRLPA